MNPAIIFSGYLTWHYGKAFIAISVIWKNFLWFTGHFFSFLHLIKTLFSPWKRMGEEYQHKGFHPSSFFEVLIINTIMRIVGIFVRLLIIIIGLFAFLLVFLSGLVFFVFWIIAPFAIPLLILIGFNMLA